MKKLLTVLLGLMMILSLSACKKQEEPQVDPEPAPTDDVVVMNYGEYAAAELGSKVVIEAYVQAAQSYWNGAKLYLQDKDGAYFVYCDGKGEDINLSEEDYGKLVPSVDYSAGWTGLCDGTKVRVEGVKSEWSGEVEIAEATVTILEGEKWVAEAEDVTALLGSDELADHMNKKVKFSGLTVAASKDAEGNDVAFLYNWDGSGAEGSNNDLYFNVTNGEAPFTFVVESYLCYEGSEVYEAVKALNVGDTVDLEGFLYWYNGANPHITSVTVR
ncbi:MAG: hypothetical protein IJI44_08610 [Erysipelotrichaceae bacterium]|nr:hypothetical protein [Erysipelotrichaceae bacterium]MBR2534078.1 hypothetical protein [Erysipelotrichaceae bacterium]